MTLSAACEKLNFYAYRGLEWKRDGTHAIGWRLSRQAGRIPWARITGLEAIAIAQHFCRQPACVVCPGGS